MIVLFNHNKMYIFTSCYACVSQQTFRNINKLSLFAGNIPDVKFPLVRKDTVAIPAGGYVILRLKADNPGKKEIIFRKSLM